MGKCVFLVYGPSLEALFAIMCSTACLLHDIFTFSQCFRHHFAEKWTLLSEFTSHKYGRLTLPARYVVFTCRHDVVLLESPALNCMLCFATLKLLCRSEIEGRRCCPPQRAFNNACYFFWIKSRSPARGCGIYWKMHIYMMCIYE